MRFDVILALTDLSSHENMAVQRACLLAAGHGARVRLMHVPSRRPTVAGLRPRA
jgi:nucleotide-binding universal stress UspA family protein